ncbi:MAG: hypothetical protein IKA53_01210 [Clostridia bacterium]|nr:hypothetical protein [Clostridia bacterium]MBQ8268584.1 hypothetical protein [Clostridia bacterium]MBR2324642.1 hypothetical protein [Clostridia bacterium]
MTQNENASQRLSYFTSLYEKSKNAAQSALALYDRHMRQYRGSAEIDGSTEKAVTVRNITYEMIEGQVSSHIPPPKVDPTAYSEEKVRLAQSVERLLVAVREKLPYEQMNDLDERFCYIYGGSVWFAEWDSRAGVGNKIGGVTLHCLSPKDFIPQPGARSVEDMDYCFLRFDTTKAELIRKYGVSEESLSLAEREYDSDAYEGDADEGATVILCFYRDENGRIGEYAFSGELTLTDIPDYYARKRRICTACGGEEQNCLCEHPRFTLENQNEEGLHLHTLPDGKQVFAPARDAKSHLYIPYYTPKRFPIVIRKNTSLEGSLFGASDCEVIRPQQQAINKIESRILQKLLRAGVTPVVPEDATITLNNSVFGQLIKMKPGESAAQYGKVDTTPDISQDIAEASRLYDHAKRILGISDALVGIDNAKNESGYARKLQISQATGRLESKRKMKYTAYAELDRLIFEYHLAFADEPRRISYRDAYGRLHNATFNRYDFIAPDETDGSFYYDDDYLFSVDLNGGAEAQRELLWEKNLENLKSGALGDPTLAVTLLRYWQCQERAHYPYARENVEYFQSAINEQTEAKAKAEEVIV